MATAELLVSGREPRPLPRWVRRYAPAAAGLLVVALLAAAAVRHVLGARAADRVVEIFSVASAGGSDQPDTIFVGINMSNDAGTLTVTAAWFEPAGGPARVPVAAQVPVAAGTSAAFEVAAPLACDRPDAAVGQLVVELRPHSGRTHRLTYLVPPAAPQVRAARRAACAG